LVIRNFKATFNLASALDIRSVKFVRSLPRGQGTFFHGFVFIVNGVQEHCVVVLIQKFPKSRKNDASKLEAYAGPPFFLAGAF